MKTLEEIENEFFGRVVKDGDCWLWMGGKTSGGYGTFRPHGKSCYAHRFSYEYFYGDIPQGFEIDHLCKNRSCVNPLCLQAVTPAENRKRQQLSPERHLERMKDPQWRRKLIRKLPLDQRFSGTTYRYPKERCLTPRMLPCFMAKDTMVNFRVKSEELDSIERAAKSVGMSRSEFIRNAVFTTLNKFNSTGKVDRAPQEKPSPCPHGGKASCPIASWQKLATGIKLCGTCGIRRK